MKKTAIILLIAILLLSSVSLVACNKSIDGTVFQALSDLKNAGKIDMEYVGVEGSGGVVLTKVKYDGLTMDYNGESTIKVFINSKDSKNINQNSVIASYTYNGEVYKEAASIDEIKCEEGMKLLIVYTSADFLNNNFAPSKGDAILFSLPDKVEKVTLD